MRSAIIAASLALAACSPSAPSTPAASAPPVAEQASAPQAPNNCPASASFPWSAGSAAFTIEASTTGESCASAQATITIRDGSGGVVHTEIVPVTQTQALAGAESVADMERMLREWITPAGASKDSTGDLAVWAAGAPEPIDAEVPFHPQAGITRDTYETLRRADAPMYCYEQSTEGAVCLAVRNGALGVIGVQTFAG